VPSVKFDEQSETSKSRRKEKGRLFTGKVLGKASITQQDLTREATPITLGVRDGEIELFMYFSFEAHETQSLGIQVDIAMPLVISAVNTGQLGQQRGLLAGDVVVKLNDRPVGTLSSEDICEQFAARPLALAVRRVVPSAQKPVSDVTFMEIPSDSKETFKAWIKDWLDCLLDTRHTQDPYVQALCAYRDEVAKGSATAPRAETVAQRLCTEREDSLAAFVKALPTERAPAAAVETEVIKSDCLSLRLPPPGGRPGSKLTGKRLVLRRQDVEDILRDVPIPLMGPLVEDFTSAGCGATAP